MSQTDNFDPPPIPPLPPSDDESPSPNTHPLLPTIHVDNVVTDENDVICEDDPWMFSRNRGTAVFLTEDFDIPITRARGATAQTTLTSPCANANIINRPSLSINSSPHQTQHNNDISPRLSQPHINSNFITKPPVSESVQSLDIPTPQSTQQHQHGDSEDTTNPQPRPNPVITTYHPDPSISPLLTPNSRPKITKPMLEGIRISENHFGPSTNDQPFSIKNHLNTANHSPQSNDFEQNNSSPTPSSTQMIRSNQNHTISKSKLIVNTAQQNDFQTTPVPTPTAGLTTQRKILSPSNTQQKNDSQHGSLGMMGSTAYQKSHKLALEQLKRHSVYKSMGTTPDGKPGSPRTAPPKTQFQSVPYIPTLFDPENSILPVYSSDGTASSFQPIDNSPLTPSSPSTQFFFTNDDLYNISQLHSQHYINGLKLWTVSLNMGAHDIEGGSGNKYKKEIQQSLPALFPPGMDIYILAVQEGKGETVADLVNAYLSEHHDVFMLPNAFPAVEGRGDGSFLSTKYTGIVSFARRSLMPFISIIGSTAYSLGITQGSKGGACLAMMVFGMTFLFIGVHLPANSLSGRLDSITTILSNCVQKMFPGLAGFEATNIFHNVIFMGDTNFKMQISDIDALNCIYDQGIKNKQNGWFKPLGDSGTLPTSIPSDHHHQQHQQHQQQQTQNITQSQPPPQTSENTKTNLTSPQVSLFPTSQSALTSNLLNTAGISTLPHFAQFDKSYGLSWMYAMDELTNAHKQYHLMSNFSEPLPSPLLFPTYKRIEGTVLANPHDSTEIKSMFRTRFKEAFYKGGNVVVRVPAFTDRIVFTSLINAIHPLRYSTQNVANPQNLYHTAFQYQRSAIPQSDITNQMIFLRHAVNNKHKLYKTFTVSQKLVNQPKSISALSTHHSQLIPQRALQYPSYGNSLDNHFSSTQSSHPDSTPSSPNTQSSSNNPISLTIPTDTNEDIPTKTIFNPRVSHLPHACDIYSCIETLTFSDHRPVVAGFQVAIPAIYMPTILSYMEYWIKEQQKIATPPPPSTTSDDNDNLTQTNLSSPHKPDLTKSIFFPPLPTLRPFPRQSLLWLEPPLTLLSDAVRNGVFCFRIMASNLTLLIPHAASRSQAIATPLTSQHRNNDILASISHQSVVDDVNPNKTQDSSQQQSSQRLSIPIIDTPSNTSGTYQALQSANSQKQGSKFGTFKGAQPTGSNKFGTFSSFTSSKAVNQQLSSSTNPSNNNNTTTTTTTNTSNIKSGEVESTNLPNIPIYRARNHADLLNTSKMGKKDDKKDKDEHVSSNGGAYSTQSKISKGSHYRPMRYQEPIPGSPLIGLNGFDQYTGLLNKGISGSSSTSQLSSTSISHSTSQQHNTQFTETEYLDMTSKELIGLSNSMNNDIPIMVEYTYASHPINYAKMLFPAPLEHISLIPRIQTLHRHTSQQTIATAAAPANWQDKTNSNNTTNNNPSSIDKSSSSQPTVHSLPQSTPTMYHYVTVPQGTPNDIALATTMYNAQQNIAKIPVLQLEYPLPQATPISKSTFAAQIRQASSTPTVAQPLTTQGKTFYHNLYDDNLFSLPIKHFKARSANSINASFETNNPYVYSTLHCCLSLDLNSQKTEECEELKNVQIAASHRVSVDHSTVASVSSSGKHQPFSLSHGKDKDGLVKDTTTTNPNSASNHTSPESYIDTPTASYPNETREHANSLAASDNTNDLFYDGFTNTNNNGKTDNFNSIEHPFSPLPDCVQANIQLSLFDFLYSHKFHTQGFGDDDGTIEESKKNSKGAQEPITIDVPIYSGGTQLMQHGLPIKLRLNINPYYSIRQPTVVFSD